MKHNILLLLMVLLLSACTNNQNETETETETDSASEANTESEESAEAEETASVNFRNVEVNVDGNQVIMTGEANATEGAIYYTLELEEDLLIEEEKVTLEEGSSVWSTFEIKMTLPVEASESADTFIATLYGKNNNGKVVNPNYIPVDLATMF
ncbi:hypothetical protein QGM71_09045 [Virgibacillus sp. C22-A2]|uniref:Bacterial spore germination immunoglobulin-like domain-containing protein n=1 Tax=Virgibacillus tibetensis TaxID=3042313 RepID=A0ABU6KE76_9BACI|nr:hypothetical protein [Virgibacillus sp. C22-A2]